MGEPMSCQIMGGHKDGDWRHLRSGTIEVTFPIEVLNHAGKRVPAFWICPVRDNKIWWHEGKLTH